MVMRTRLLCVLGLLMVCAVGRAGVSPAITPSAPEAVLPSTRTPIMEGLLFQAYDQASHGAKVEAARAYASTKRWGFLQVALIPTVELEDVTVESTAPDGTLMQKHWPTAVMDLSTKRLHTPSGTFDVLPHASTDSQS